MDDFKRLSKLLNQPTDIAQIFYEQTLALLKEGLTFSIPVNLDSEVTPLSGIYWLMRTHGDSISVVDSNHVETKDLFKLLLWGDDYLEVDLKVEEHPELHCCQVVRIAKFINIEQKDWILNPLQTDVPSARGQGKLTLRLVKPGGLRGLRDTTMRKPVEQNYQLNLRIKDALWQPYVDVVGLPEEHDNSLFHRIQHRLYLWMQGVDLNSFKHASDLFNKVFSNHNMIPFRDPYQWALLEKHILDPIDNESLLKLIDSKYDERESENVKFLDRLTKLKA